MLLYLLLTTNRHRGHLHLRANSVEKNSFSGWSDAPLMPAGSQLRVWQVCTSLAVSVALRLHAHAVPTTLLAPLLPQASATSCSLHRRLLARCKVDNLLHWSPRL